MEKCLNVTIIEVKDQSIYCVVEDPRTHVHIYLTIVFAKNEQNQFTVSLRILELVFTL